MGIGVRQASGAISNLPHVTPTLGGVGRRSYFAPVSTPDDPEFVPIRADLARPFILHKADMGLTRYRGGADRPGLPRVGAQRSGLLAAHHQWWRDATARLFKSQPAVPLDG